MKEVNQEVIVDGVFAYPVLVANLAEVIRQDTDIQKEILQLANYTVDQNNFEMNGSRNFLSKDYQVLNGKKLHFIIQKFLDYYSENVLGEEPKLGISISWMNLNPPGTYHLKHKHPNSRISGCFYINVDDNTGNLNIYRPEEMLDDYRDDIVKNTPYNWTHMTYKPQKYDLYLFPSRLYHSVEENLSDISRLSLAFNTFYVKDIGSRAQKLPIMES